MNRTIPTKTIEGATSATTTKQWMANLVLVEVNHEAYFTNLTKLNQIGEMPIKVSAHRSLKYAKGVVRFKQVAEGLTNEELARDLNMSWRNNDFTSGEINQQGNHYQGRQEGTNRNILPDFSYPNPARTHPLGLWKVQCNTIHPPPQALLQVPAIWPWSTYLPGHWKCLSVVFRHWSQTGRLSKQGLC